MSDHDRRPVLSGAPSGPSVADRHPDSGWCKVARHLGLNPEEAVDMYAETIENPDETSKLPLVKVTTTMVHTLTLEEWQRAFGGQSVVDTDPSRP